MSSSENAIVPWGQTGSKPKTQASIVVHLQKRAQILRQYIQPSLLNPNKFKYAMRKAFGQIQVRPLINRIQIMQNMWGGVQCAYDMEWKIRQFVIEVINYALIQKKEAFQMGVGGQAQKLLPGGLKLDGEKAIE